MRTVPPIALVVIGVALGTVETFGGWPMVGMLHIVGMVALASMVYIGRSYGTTLSGLITGRGSWSLAAIALAMPWAHQVMMERVVSSPDIQTWGSIVITLALVAIVIHDAASAESGPLVMGGGRRLEQTLPRNDGGAIEPMDAVSSFIDMEDGQAMTDMAEVALEGHGIRLDDVDDVRIEAARSPRTTRMGVRTDIARGLVETLEEMTGVR